jgi:hypothetical protein
VSEEKTCFDEPAGEDCEPPIALVDALLRLGGRCRGCSVVVFLNRSRDMENVQIGEVRCGVFEGLLVLVVVV